MAKRNHRVRKNSSGQASPWTMREDYLALCGAAAIGVLTFLVYWPALSGGFIWDDNLLVAHSKLIRAGDGLYRIWFTQEPIDYWPLTNTTFWIEWRLWGANPTGYHVTNVLLHIAAALLIWQILRMLSVPGAFLAAVLFAVHPMNVESVAWIAQRKNTLSMLFFLLAILWYLCQEVQRRGRGKAESPKLAGFGYWYWLSLFAFLMAMLSKGSAAILPLLLLGIIWWQHRRLGVGDVARLGPFFLIASALACVNIWFQTHGLEAIRSATLAERFTGAGAVIWFYLAKALAPIDLVFVYPQWEIDSSEVVWWLPALAAIVLTFLLLKFRDAPLSGRALLFAWGCFCVALLPVLGFTDVYFMKFSLVADHYAYIALVAVVASLAAGYSAWHRSSGRQARFAAIFASMVVGALMLLARQQSQLYANATTLYEATLAKNPNCWMAHNNLGTEYLHSGQPQSALIHFERAVQLKSDFLEGHTNACLALAKCGRMHEAVEHCRQVVRSMPDFPEGHNTLGSLLCEMGQLPDAIEQLHEALRLRPDYADAYYNLGLALAKSGESQEAIKNYERALQLNPDYFEAHNNLANALNAAGRPQESLAHFEQALRLKPDSAIIHFNLGITLAAIGRGQEAISHYQRAIELAQSTGQSALAQQIENWVRSHSAGQANAQKSP